ncbi:MAG: prenyltransferase [Anaerolineales bacterium]|nr:MAG: prenyltransferase [Anaerolineales bacterium]
MNSTFAMWRKSLSQLIQMDDKKDWDALDVLSKWFIATRSAVGTVTLYSGLIGGLLAWQYLRANNGAFNLLTWCILTLGLFIAHGTNNLINDYTDFSRGIDKDNYFRTQYGVHPLAQGFWDKSTHLLWFGVSGLLAALSGLYALYITDFAPVVAWLFGVGAFILLFYTYPLKYIGIGELSIFVIWGPLMIGGVFYVLTGVWSWTVVLASLPVGLNVMSINLGKHTDKGKEDALKGVRTLPVLLGETLARYVTMSSILISYIIMLYLVFAIHFFTPVMLLVFLAYKPALAALQRLSKPRPSQPPAGYPIWPRWFSTVCFVHNRAFSNYFVLALIVDTVLRTFVSAFWR